MQVHHATVFDDATRHVARVYAEALLRRRRQAAADARSAGANWTRWSHDVSRPRSGLGGLPRQRRRRPRSQGRCAAQSLRGPVSDVFFNFLLVLNDHDRLDLLRRCRLHARAVTNDAPAACASQVRSAVPLADEQQRAAAAGTARHVPAASRSCDPRRSRPAGRPVVRVGDWVYDGSVRRTTGTTSEPTHREKQS